jgi:hypothetical protein
MRHSRAIAIYRYMYMYHCSERCRAGAAAPAHARPGPLRLRMHVMQLAVRLASTREFETRHYTRACTCSRARTALVSRRSRARPARKAQQKWKEATLDWVEDRGRIDREDLNNRYRQANYKRVPTTCNAAGAAACGWAGATGRSQAHTGTHSHAVSTCVRTSGRRERRRERSMRGGKGGEKNKSRERIEESKNNEEENRGFSGSRAVESGWMSGGWWVSWFDGHSPLYLAAAAGASASKKPSFCRCLIMTSVASATLS